MSLHIQSPLLLSDSLSNWVGTTVAIKMDALQPAGSFKIRGVGFACEEYAARGARRFVSSSGGNAGLAVAYAGRMLGIPVTVVVPETTSAIALRLLKQSGADIVVMGQSWHEANTAAQNLIGDTDAFIHPFDDPLLWRGHASLITEVVAADFIPDAVVLAVGGGGLLCGVVEGLVQAGLGKTSIFAAETTGAASLAAATQAGHLVMLPEITSIASSLGAKQVCQRALDLCLTHSVRCIQLTDLNALSACRQFLTDHRVLVEPACGAALAVAYEHPQVLKNFQQVLMIVCGGVTASLSGIEEAYLRELDIMRACRQ